MKVGYVVLYVNDADTCRRFWVEQVGMVEKRRSEAGTFELRVLGPRGTLVRGHAVMRPG
jgi:catechol 2,3-dioxygenase-like lactoylglutathione lyase family enzyme